MEVARALRSLVALIIIPLGLSESCALCPEISGEPVKGFGQKSEMREFSKLTLRQQIGGNKTEDQKSLEGAAAI